jgi:hypothetical protein
MCVSGRHRNSVVPFSWTEPVSVSLFTLYYESVSWDLLSCSARRHLDNVSVLFFALRKSVPLLTRVIKQITSPSPPLPSPCSVVRICVCTGVHRLTAQTLVTIMFLPFFSPQWNRRALCYLKTQPILVWLDFERNRSNCEGHIPTLFQQGDWQFVVHWESNSYLEVYFEAYCFSCPWPAV